MRVYMLKIQGRAPLAQALDRLMDHPAVESCAIEPQQERVRFTAESKAGDGLVERIYQEGGLAWCTRHPFTVAKD
jgi:hypothetical protein